MLSPENCGGASALACSPKRDPATLRPCVARRFGISFSGEGAVFAVCCTVSSTPRNVSWTGGATGQQTGVHNYRDRECITAPMGSGEAHPQSLVCPAHRGPTIAVDAGVPGAAQPGRRRVGADVRRNATSERVSARLVSVGSLLVVGGALCTLIIA